MKAGSEDRVALNGLSIRVANYGYTEAFKVTAKGEVAIGPSTGAQYKPERLSIPSVVKRMASAETVQTADSVVVNFVREGYTTSIAQAGLDQIKNGAIHLRLVGLLEYVDVTVTHTSPHSIFFGSKRKSWRKG